MSRSASTAVGRVVGLWRYPVKSMMGEELNAVEVTERGLVGDHNRVNVGVYASVLQGGRVRRGDPVRLASGAGA